MTVTVARARQRRAAHRARKAKGRAEHKRNRWRHAYKQIRKTADFAARHF